MSDPVRTEYDPYAPPEAGPVAVEYDENEAPVEEEAADGAPSEGAVVDYSSMKKAELIAEVESRPGDLDASGTKAELIEVLKQDDEYGDEG